MYYPCSENKGADLRLCFRIMQKAGFLMLRLINLLLVNISVIIRLIKQNGILLLVKKKLTLYILYCIMIDAIFLHFSTEVFKCCECCKYMPKNEERRRKYNYMYIKRVKKRKEKKEKE